jgi:hypothetical protein
MNGVPEILMWAMFLMGCFVTLVVFWVFAAGWFENAFHPAKSVDELNVAAPLTLAAMIVATSLCGYVAASISS